MVYYRVCMIQKPKNEYKLVRVAICEIENKVYLITDDGIYIDSTRERATNEEIGHVISYYYNHPAELTDGIKEIITGSEVD